MAVSIFFSTYKYVGASEVALNFERKYNYFEEKNTRM
jgi:hypothetical protein